MERIQREQLIAAAVRIRERAYAPYSGFRVGAAVQTADGRQFAAGNVENASYGLTICAERAAVFQAVAAGQPAIVAIAVAAPGLAAPCGACRQVLAEFADDLPILLVNAEHPGQVQESSLRELLPYRFALRARPATDAPT
jgi:cytidine deaminase